MNIIKTALSLTMMLAATFVASSQTTDDQTDTTTHQRAMPAHFTWGADVGGSVDMSENNMSTIDISANLGYKSDIIQMLGAGASLNMMVSNSCRSFPVYAIFRSSFTKKTTLCFMETKAGASVNYLPNNISQTGLYLSCGLGINLATGRNFRSHMILSYSFFDRGYVTYDGEDHSLSDLHYIGVKIGLSF